MKDFGDVAASEVQGRLRTELKNLMQPFCGVLTSKGQARVYDDHFCENEAKEEEMEEKAEANAHETKTEVSIPPLLEARHEATTMWQMHDVERLADS